MASDDTLCWYHGRLTREAAEELLLNSKYSFFYSLDPTAFIFIYLYVL